MRVCVNVYAHYTHVFTLLFTYLPSEILHNITNGKYKYTTYSLAHSFSHFSVVCLVVVVALFTFVFLSPDHSVRVLKGKIRFRRCGTSI